MARPCSASDGQVRNQKPPVLPCLARSLKVGEVDAGEICTTWLGAVTEVRMAALTPLDSAPMRAGTCCTSTSFLAASTPTEGLVWSSSSDSFSSQVLPPRAAFRSLMASSLPLAICWPSTPSEPVSDITAPTVVLQAAWAGAAPSVAIARPMAASFKDGCFISKTSTRSTRHKRRQRTCPEWVKASRHCPAPDGNPKNSGESHLVLTIRPPGKNTVHRIGRLCRPAGQLVRAV
jgi:hypothetical protein